jgi:hypothetical protein|tara:strand:- start:323 stop:475 length:153 start_codon:yes stop_codon:yes gene_type:complete
MKILFKFFAKLNNYLLPSLSKNKIDLAKANKFQLLTFAWKLYVTKRIINQ